MAVSLEPAAATAVPGAPVAFTLTVRNDSGIVQHYTLTPDEALAPFVTLEPRELAVMKGASATAVVTVTVPRSAEVPSGETALGVRVNPTDRDGTAVGDSETAEATLVIAEFVAVDAELVPKLARSRGGGARVRLAVDDTGNTDAWVGLAGVSTDRVRVEPRDPELVIEPGHAQFGRLVVTPQKRMWRGTAASHPYQVVVSPNGGEAVTVDGTLIQEPVFPPWFWKALVVLAALIALLILLWNLLLKPTVEQTARDAVADPLAAVQQQAEAAQDAAQAAKQAADAAKDIPPAVAPAPPAPTAVSTDQTMTVAIEAASGETESENLRAEIPPGAVLRITDLVVGNPDGDVGSMKIGYGNDTVFLLLGTENYRDLDLHFVTPIEVPSGETPYVSLTCEQPGRLPAGAEGGDCSAHLLVTGTLVTPPA